MIIDNFSGLYQPHHHWSPDWAEDEWLAEVYWPGDNWLREDHITVTGV